MTEALTATVPTSTQVANGATPEAAPTNNQVAIKADRSSAGLATIATSASLNQQTQASSNSQRSATISQNQNSAPSSASSLEDDIVQLRDQTITVSSTIGKFSRATLTRDEAVEVYSSISKYL